MGCFGNCDKEDEKEHDIRQGPNKNRGCTDIICALIYMAFMAFWIASGVMAFQSGDPMMLIYPMDSYGNLCGDAANTQTKDRPYLMYYDITACANLGDTITSNGQCATHQSCRAECPAEFWSYYTNVLPQITLQEVTSPATMITCADQPGNPACIDFSKFICKRQYNSVIEDITDGTTNFADAKTNLQQLIDDGDCAEYYVPSIPIQHRCMPGTADGNQTEFEEQLEESGNTNLTTDGLTEGIGGLASNAASEAFNLAMADIQTTYPVILLGLALAMVVSFTWIFLMRFFAAVIIWIMIFGLFGILAFGTYYTYTQWALLSGQEVIGGDLTAAYIGGIAQQSGTVELWLALFIIACILLLVFTVLLLFFAKRLRIATRIIGEASKAIGKIMSSMFFPLFTGVMYMAVTAYFALTSAYIATSAEANFHTFNKSDVNNSVPCNIKEWNNESHEHFDNPEVTCIFDRFTGNYAWTNETIYVHLVNLFGFYWTMNYITALGQMTLSGAFSHWYFTMKKSDLPSLTLWASFKRTFYHIGTMAFGSLIIAIIQILRTILNYIERKSKKRSTKCIKAIVCMCKCCLWCLENVFKYINKNAYILTAMYGYNFCKASCKAVKLIIANAARAAAILGVTTVLLFIGKFVVASGCAAFTWAFFAGQFGNAETNSFVQFMNSDPDQINYIWFPTVITFIGAYVIAVGFFNVYQMAIDTIFLCFLEDLERNDGSANKPYFMSKSLMGLLGKKNKTTGDKELKKM